ncbi:MAG: nucleotidyltransferase family protein [Thermoplasmata archaeon]|nr:nucleotidyltransferase family protein [Thermoplasmata archaeon]
MATGRSFEEIKSVLERHKKELEERFGVKEIGVFGSFVRGEEKKASDVDILVDFYPGADMDLIKFVELEYYLSDLLGANVDLVMKSALRPRIGESILKEVVYV